MSKDLLKQWVLRKIYENPKLYGGDNGNPAIIREYLRELHGKTKVENLTLEAISHCVAVSRIRNKILEKHPEFDFRVKHKAKVKNKYHTEILLWAN